MLIHTLQYKGPKETQQDAYYISPDQDVMVICDGMGSHHMSHIASQFIAQDLGHRLSRLLDFSESTIISSFKESQLSLRQKVNEEQVSQNIGTTCTAAIIKKDMIVLAHIGDSKAFLVSNAVIYVSRDHSMTEDLYAVGAITKEERDQQKNGRLTKAIVANQSKATTPDIEMIMRPTGFKLLLCTDGLMSLMSEEKILGMLGSDTPLDSLKSSIEDRIPDMDDNTTLILLEG